MTHGRFKRVKASSTHANVAHACLTDGHRTINGLLHT
jgi:hypothetical protein